MATDEESNKWYRLGVFDPQGIIDAEEANKSLQVVEALRSRPRKRPVIIDPPKPSPHEFMDRIMDLELLQRAFQRIETDRKIAEAFHGVDDHEP